MPTCWIVNEAGHDYSRALDIIEDGSELRPLTQGNSSPLLVDRNNWHLARGIAKFAHEDDYILISGTPMLNAQALLIWMLHFKKARILQWNAKRRKYILTTITLEQMQNLIDDALFG